MGDFICSLFSVYNKCGIFALYRLNKTLQHMFFQSLVELDRDLLLFLNSFHNHFFDAFMWIVSSKEIWVPLYLIIIYYFFKNRDKKQAFTILCLCIICIVLCDQIASSIFKPLFERWRPSRDPSISDIVHIVNGKRGGKYGFISSHAANVFGLAIFSLKVFRNKLYTILILSWAIVVSYSRIYLGVHFPGDVICGGLLGLGIGYACYKILTKIFHIKETRTIRVPLFIIVFSVLFFCIISVSRYMYFAN